MTRKQAIQEAILVISSQEIDQDKKDEIIEKLNDISEELPLSHWSKKSILDACDQYVLDTGRQIPVTHFTNSRKLPSPPVIQHHFKMNAKEFRDSYYPLDKSLRLLAKFNVDYSKRKSKFSTRPLDEINREFVEEFNRKKISGMYHYNRVRDNDHPSYSTLMKLNKVDTWNELLAKLGLSTYGADDIEITVSSVAFEDGTEI